MTDADDPGDWDDWDEDSPFMCPVRDCACGDSLCAEYGCALKAGIDPSMIEGVDDDM